MKSRKKLLFGSILTLSLGGLLPAFGQDPNPPAPAPSSGWRRFESTNPQDAGAPAGQAGPAPRYQNAPAPSAPAPARITLPAGTWITVRMLDGLSSDHNQPGDAFMATLAQPIIASGVVLARRGQNVSGVVSEAKKAGRVEGVSRLGLEIVEIAMADGRQMQVKTRVMERKGETSYGRDAAGIGATVGAGAAIGAAVNGGVGAGIGAAAGVVASTIGVLFTRGRATTVYPEQVMSFRLEEALAIDNTEAFQPFSQQDYGREELRQAPPPQRYAYGPPAPYYYGGWYPPYGYFYGPSFYFRTGPGYFAFRGHGGRRR